MEDENIALKNKIAELKQRLQQIHVESFADINRTKVFEYEFSLYLKACEEARKERSEQVRLQHDATKLGLAALVIASALTVYLFTMHIVFGMVILLGLGFFACGFMFLLLGEEIRSVRAGTYCAELERFFTRYRWSAEEYEKLHLPTLPLWEHYRFNWDKDLFRGGHYERTAVYAPLRIATTLADVLALGYVIHSFVTGSPEVSWTVLLVCCGVWIVAVALQMILVFTITRKVDSRLDVIEGEGATEPAETAMNWHPRTWVNLLRLFFITDVIFPKRAEKR